MFNNTLLKTIYSKRWMLAAWFIGITALVVFTIALFPTFSKSLGESLKDVPDSLKAFVGDSTTYSTIAGFTDLQIIAQMQFMILIFGIILFTGVLAGEENEGSLQTLLGQPISRGRVYLEKLAAASLLLAGVCMSIVVGVLIGLLFINEQLDVGRLLGATFATWLVSLVFSGFGFALGAITGKRGLSGGLAGALAFTALLISSLADSVSSLKTVDKFSPFHYFNKPGILQYGVNWSDLAVLAIVSALILVIGAVVFAKRDIYQR